MQSSVPLIETHISIHFNPTNHSNCTHRHIFVPESMQPEQPHQQRISIIYSYLIRTEHWTYSHSLAEYQIKSSTLTRNKNNKILLILSQRRISGESFGQVLTDFHLPPGVRRTSFCVCCGAGGAGTTRKGQRDIDQAAEAQARSWDGIGQTWNAGCSTEQWKKNTWLFRCI